MTGEGAALLGATGRLGTALRRCFPDPGNLICYSGGGTGDTTGADLALASPGDLLGPGVRTVFNCAGISSTSACRRNPFKAFLVNSLWPLRLARFCLQHDKRLVHISTDLVWSGGIPPYRSGSPGVPMSLYGWTKLLGDLGAGRVNPRALVVRTSVLVGEIGARKPTFTEDILAGRATSFYIDSIRHHTPAMSFSKTLIRLASEETGGLLIAASDRALCRLAYAATLIPEPDGVPAPPGVPKNLTLIPDVAVPS